jgi:hypothetical protein
VGAWAPSEARVLLRSASSPLKGRGPPLKDLGPLKRPRPLQRLGSSSEAQALFSCPGVLQRPRPPTVARTPSRGQGHLKGQRPYRGQDHLQRSRPPPEARVPSNGGWKFEIIKGPGNPVSGLASGPRANAPTRGQGNPQRPGLPPEPRASVAGPRPLQRPGPPPEARRILSPALL